jgi:hypothetical protein
LTLKPLDCIVKLNTVTRQGVCCAYMGSSSPTKVHKAKEAKALQLGSQGNTKAKQNCIK